LTVGRTVESAVWWFITMERTCQVQLLAMAAGQPISIDDASAKAAHDVVGTEIAGQFSFQSLFDQIIKLQPDLLD